MSFILILDICAGIFFGMGFIYILWFNKKLVAVQGSHQKFQNLFDTISKALDRGQASLQHLEEMNSKIAGTLDDKMASASQMIQDLNFFMGRAEGLICQLEESARDARALQRNFPEVIEALAGVIPMDSSRELEEIGLREEMSSSLNPIQSIQEEILMKHSLETWNQDKKRDYASMGRSGRL